MGNQTQAADLRALLERSHFSFIQLAAAILSADLATVGWKANDLARASRLKARGGRLSIELSVVQGEVQIALVGTSAEGERCMLGSVSERAQVMN